LLEIHRPRIHKYYLHVEKDEQNCYEEIFNGKGAAGVAVYFNTTLEGFELDFGLVFRSHPVGHSHYQQDESQGNDKHHYHRQKYDGLIDR